MTTKRYIITLLTAVLIIPLSYAFKSDALKLISSRKEVKFDREFILESTMLGYIGQDGKRNPTLKMSKGELVRIKLVNGELMTHDIAIEKAGVKSKTLVEKGDTTSVVFRADKSDVYFCSIPGHRAAGMVGKIEVTEGAVKTEVVVAGMLPKKELKR